MSVAILTELLKEEIMVTKKNTQRTKPKKGEPRVRLQLNIDSVPGLYVALEKQAKKELRSPTDQAIWLLKTALKI